MARRSTGAGRQHLSFTGWNSLSLPQDSRYRTRMPKTIGLVLAGGRSARMRGDDKAFIILAGQTLLARVIARLAPQVDAVAINSNAAAENFSAYGLPVIPDLMTGHLGPLAGIHAGLSAYPNDRVLSVAVDLPFLPLDLARRLKAGMSAQHCAYAASGGQHALAILWVPGMAQDVETYLQRGGRSLRDWLGHNGAAVDFTAGNGHDILLNINTPEDLHAAELRITAQQQQQQQQ